jgi:hypothetical protein
MTRLISMNNWLKDLPSRPAWENGGKGGRGGGKGRGKGKEREKRKGERKDSYSRILIAKQ